MLLGKWLLFPTGTQFSHFEIFENMERAFCFNCVQMM